MKTDSLILSVIAATVAFVFTMYTLPKDTPKIEHPRDAMERKILLDYARWFSENEGRESYQIYEYLPQLVFAYEVRDGYFYEYSSSDCGENVVCLGRIDTLDHNNLPTHGFLAKGWPSLSNACVLVGGKLYPKIGSACMVGYAQFDSGIVINPWCTERCVELHPTREK